MPSRILECLNPFQFLSSGGKFFCFHDFRDVPANDPFGINWDGDERECVKCGKTYVTEQAERGA